MNKDIKTTRFQKCLREKCGYEGNSLSDIVCRACQFPLNGHTSISTQKQVQFTRKVDWKLLLLIPTLFLATGIIAKIFSSNYSEVFSIRDKKPSLNQNKTLKHDRAEPSEVADRIRNTQVKSKIKIYQKIADVGEVPKGTFNYGGSICFAPLFSAGFLNALRSAHPDFQLRYVEPEKNPGCIAKVDRLLTKELSFAHNAQPLTQINSEFSFHNPSNLESVAVGIDGIVFYINKSLPLKSLSLKQLQDIYLGKVNNWNSLGEVGLPDLPITPVSLDPESDNTLQLLNLDLEFVDRDRVKIVRDYTTAIRQVASTPGAISYSSAAILKDQQSVRPIALRTDENTVPISALLEDGQVNLQAMMRNNYPLTRQLFVVINLDGSIDEKAGVAYVNALISAEGQEFIKKAGFVPNYSE